MWITIVGHLYKLQRKQHIIQKNDTNKSVERLQLSRNGDEKARKEDLLEDLHNFRRKEYVRCRQYVFRQTLRNMHFQIIKSPYKTS